MDGCLIPDKRASMEFWKHLGNFEGTRDNSKDAQLKPRTNCFVTKQLLVALGQPYSEKEVSCANVIIAC